MRKNFYLIPFLLLFVSTLKVNAQCSASVASGTASNSTYAYVTAQSFTPTCNGQVTSMSFTFPNLISDDLRGSGYYVSCNLKTASGTLLATGIMPNGTDRTDQVYPTATLTVSFDCSNITLVSGTQYIWDLTLIQYPAGQNLQLALFAI